MGSPEEYRWSSYLDYIGVRKSPNLERDKELLNQGEKVRMNLKI